MMHKFIFLTAMSVFFLSVPVAPSPLDAPLDKRSFFGKATYFNPGLGACGTYNSDFDFIVALSTELYGSGNYCGQLVSITNTANQATATGTVLDKCPGCDTYQLDLSPSLFGQINNGDLSVGVLNIEWEFITN